MTVLVLVGTGFRLYDLKYRFMGFSSVTLYPHGWGGEAGAIASSLYHGRGFANPYWTETGPTAIEAPVYPVLLTGLYEIFGDRSPNAGKGAQLVNVVLSVAIIPVLYALGEALAGSAVGLLAALLWAFWPAMGYTEAYFIWNTSLYCFLLSLAFLLAIQGHWQFAPLAGITVLVDPSATVSVGLLVLWLWFVGRRRLAVWAAISCVVISLPWLVRNTAVFGRPILRSDLGMELRRGTDDRDFSGGTKVLPLAPGRDLEELRAYRSLGEIAYNARAMRLTLAVIRAVPAHYLSIAARRFVAFWTGTGELDLLYATRLPYRHLIHLLPGLMALAGICVLIAGRSSVAALLGGVFLFQPAIYYFTLPVARYRAPLEPLAMLLGAVAILALTTIWPAKEPGLNTRK